MSQMDSNYTLVIVDMQPGFSASHNVCTINATIDEILKAIECNAPIVFIVTTPSKNGQVDRRLLDMVKDFNPSLWTIEEKHYRQAEPYSDSSAAKQVADVCEVFEYTSKRFRICGVNTHICVFFTALELNKRFPDAQLEIVVRACNDAYALDSADALRKFEYYGNLHQFSKFAFDSM